MVRVENKDTIIYGKEHRYRCRKRLYEMQQQLGAGFTKDFVKIEGDKAIYATHWLAGGNDIRWDMIHYDVQLFGGVVLQDVYKRQPRERCPRRMA